MNKYTHLLLAREGENVLPHKKTDKTQKKSWTNFYSPWISPMKFSLHKQNFCWKDKTQCYFTYKSFSSAGINDPRNRWIHSQTCFLSTLKFNWIHSPTRNPINIWNTLHDDSPPIDQKHGVLPFIICCLLAAGEINKLINNISTQEVAFLLDVDRNNSKKAAWVEFTLPNSKIVFFNFGSTQGNPGSFICSITLFFNFIIHHNTPVSQEKTGNKARRKLTCDNYFF